MGESKETKGSVLCQLAITQSEKKCCFAVSSVLLAYLDKMEGPQHFFFLISSKGKNRAFDLLRGIFFLTEIQTKKSFFCWFFFLSLFCVFVNLSPMFLALKCQLLFLAVCSRSRLSS